MSLLLTWFSESIELQRFGLNLATFGAMGANIFTCIQAWGLSKQYRSIRDHKKADGVSLHFFAFFVWYCVSFIYYGYTIHSITIVWNGMLAFLHVGVVVMIIRYRGITFLECCTVFVAPLMVVAMVLIPEKTLLLSLYLFLAILFLVLQPLKILREKNSGEVSLPFQYICIATSVFWFCYSIAIKDIALIIFNPIVLALYLWTVILCRKYRTLDVVQ